MLRRCWLYVLLICSVAAGAQTMEGIVTDGANHKPLSPVTVVNVITQHVVYTDANGYYKIAAHSGDKLAFSYLGYKTMERYKPPAVVAAVSNISLQQMEYELDAVYLRPGLLSQYQQDSIERTVIYKIPLQRRPPKAFASPASALAELFSKKAKRTYQFQKDFVAGEIERFVDTRYTPELVNSLTGFTGDTIGHFMYAYPMPYDFARAATSLEMKLWILDNLKEWKKKHEVDTSGSSK